jgi:hypothetical protein
MMRPTPAVPIRLDPALHRRSLLRYLVILLGVGLYCLLGAMAASHAQAAICGSVCLTNGGTAPVIPKNVSTSGHAATQAAAKPAQQPVNKSSGTGTNTSTGARAVVPQNGSAKTSVGTTPVQHVNANQTVHNNSGSSSGKSGTGLASQARTSSGAVAPKPPKKQQTSISIYSPFGSQNQGSQGSQSSQISQGSHINFQTTTISGGKTDTGGGGCSTISVGSSLFCSPSSSSHSSPGSSSIGKSITIGKSDNFTISNVNCDSACQKQIAKNKSTDISSNLVDLTKLNLPKGSTSIDQGGTVIFDPLTKTTGTNCDSQCQANAQITLVSNLPQGKNGNNNDPCAKDPSAEGCGIYVPTVYQPQKQTQIQPQKQIQNTNQCKNGDNSDACKIVGPITITAPIQITDTCKVGSADQGCTKPPAKSTCQQNPNDTQCVQIPAGPSESFCQMYSNDPACGRAPSDSYCQLHPNDPTCVVTTAPPGSPPSVGSPCEVGLIECRQQATQQCLLTAQQNSAAKAAEAQSYYQSALLNALMEQAALKTGSAALQQYLDGKRGITPQDISDLIKNGTLDPTDAAAAYAQAAQETADEYGDSPADVSACFGDGNGQNSDNSGIQSAKADKGKKGGQKGGGREGVESAGGGEIPMIDATGKVHGKIPDYVPDDWSTQEMYELADELEQSIDRREQVNEERGLDPGHQQRVVDEERLLRQIWKKLTGGR